MVGKYLLLLCARRAFLAEEVACTEGGAFCGMGVDVPLLILLLG